MSYPDRTTVPLPAKPKPFHFPEFRRHRLNNGLELLCASHKSLPILSVSLVVNCPAKADPAEKEGTVNLIGKLITEGTGNRSRQDILNELEFIGALYGAHNDWNAIYVEMNVLTKYIDRAMTIFADIARNPSFPEKEFERTRREIIINRLRTLDNAARLCSEHFIRRLYGDLRYGTPLEGTEASIRNITREDLIRLYETYFIPANAVLIMVGDLSDNEFIQIAGQYFSEWPPARKPDQPVQQFSMPEKLSVSLIHKPGAVQSEVRIGHPGIERKNPDYFAVTLMNEILGGYFLSRINMNLREDKGLTYGAHSAFSSRKDRGTFYVNAPVHAQATAEAIIEIIKEIENIRKNPVTTEELQNARGYLVGVFPIAFESGDQLAAALANITVFELPDDYYANYREKITRVSAEDIQQAAQKYLHPGRLQVVVTADRNLVEENLKKHFRLEVYDVHGKKIA